MQHDAFPQLRADGEYRIQGGHGILEDHANPSAANRTHGRFGQAQKIEGIQLDMPFQDAAILRQQAKDRQRGDGLPGSGFADQGKTLARRNIQRHAINRHGHVLALAKTHPEIPDG